MTRQEKLKKIIQLRSKRAELDRDLESLEMEFKEEARNLMETIKETVGDRRINIVCKHRYKTMQLREIPRKDWKFFKVEKSAKINDLDALLATLSSAQICTLLTINESAIPVSDAHLMVSEQTKDLLRSNLYTPSLEVK